MLNPDQTLAFAKTQFAALTKLGQQWLDCGEQLAALQLEAGKAALKDCAALTHELMVVRSPEQLWSVCSIASGPALEKADGYGRRLQEIMASASAGWSQFSGAHAAEAQQLFGALLTSAGQNMPQAPDMGVNLVRQWIATASASLESAQKAAMQLAELTDANWKAVSRPASQAQ